MRRFLSAITICTLQIVSYLFVNDFLQTVLNKFFRSDFYVLIVLFLLIITPAFIYLFCNSIFCSKKDYNGKTTNVLFTILLFIICNIVYYMFLLKKDDNFWGVGFSLYTCWVIVVSVILIVYYNSIKKTENVQCEETPTTHEK